MPQGPAHALLRLPVILFVALFNLRENPTSKTVTGLFCCCFWGLGGCFLGFVNKQFGALDSLDSEN